MFGQVREQARGDREITSVLSECGQGLCERRHISWHSQAFGRRQCKVKIRAVKMKRYSLLMQLSRRQVIREPSNYIHECPCPFISWPNGWI